MQRVLQIGREIHANELARIVKQTTGLSLTPKVGVALGVAFVIGSNLPPPQRSRWCSFVLLSLYWNTDFWAQTSLCVMEK